MSSVDQFSTETRAGAASRWIDVALRLSGMRRSEVSRGLNLGAAYALVLASLYVLKPARNALFLSRLGAEQLPFVMIAVAIIGGVTAVLLATVASSFRIETLTRWMFSGLALSLLAWWLGLRALAGGWQVFLFYVWINLYGQLATALVWLMAGAAVDARESRRVFAFVGALGIAGAVLGGVFTQQATRHVGTVNLLPVCAGFLLGGLWFLSRVEPSANEPKPLRHSQAPGGGILADLRGYSLLRVLLTMSLLAGIASSIIDVQFNVLVDASLTSEDEKTAFFGSFFAYLNGGAFLFQLLLTSRVMSRFGLGVSLLTLPIALSLGASFVFLVPGLFAATVLKASDAGLRHSLYKSSVEVLYVPLPAVVKKRVRMFLDATVDNLGTGIGALSVLALTVWAGVDARLLAVASLLPIALWAITAASARVAHVEAFRLALESLQIQPEELALDAADPQVRATLRRSLDSENPRQLRYALELMRGVSDPEAVLRLEQLLAHADGEIRAGALRVLAHDATVHTRVDAGALLEDSDSRVRREAAVLLARRGLGQQLQASRHEQRAVLRTLLADERPSVRAAALGAMADLDHADLLDPKRAAAVLEVRGGDAEWVRYELARALGSAPRSPEVQDLLGILARDASPRVVKRAIRSAGRLTDPALVSELSERLADRSSRGPAIEALIACGPSAVARLAPELRGNRSTLEKLSVVRVLSRIEDQTAVDGLSAALPNSSGGLRHALLRALNRLRVRGSALAFPPTLTRDELQQEVGYHRALTRLVKLQPEAKGPADKLLLRALREKRDDSLELVFRLLALLYSPKDMHNAFAAVRSRHPRAKANAIEFLDNVLAPRDKRQVLPLVEAPGRAGLPNSRRRSVSAGEAKPGLAELISGRDAWLRACAVFCGSGDPALRGPIEDALRDPEAIVREAAAFALSHPRPPC